MTTSATDNESLPAPLARPHHRPVTATPFELGTRATVETSHPHSFAKPKRAIQTRGHHERQRAPVHAGRAAHSPARRRESRTTARPTAAIRKAAIPAGVAAGALMLLADAGSAFAGMDLGNHNETRLTPAAGPVAPERPRRANRRALAATVGVAAGALMLLADAGPAFAGLNLGNHNETLLTPAAVAKPSDRRHVARRLALSTLVVAASFGVTAAFVNDGTSNTRHSAYPGNYCSSSGGGRNCPQRP